MFTLEELEKGVFIGTNRVKVEILETSKLIHFSKPVRRPQIGFIGNIFNTEVPNIWELIEEIKYTDEQFVQFANLLIKDLMKNYDLISF